MMLGEVNYVDLVLYVWFVVSFVEVWVGSILIIEVYIKDCKDEYCYMVVSLYVFYGNVERS